MTINTAITNATDRFQVVHSHKRMFLLVDEWIEGVFDQRIGREEAEAAMAPVWLRDALVAMGVSDWDVRCHVDRFADVGGDWVDYLKGVVA